MVRRGKTKKQKKNRLPPKTERSSCRRPGNGGPSWTTPWTGQMVQLRDQQPRISRSGRFFCRGNPNPDVENRRIRMHGQNTDRTLQLVKTCFLFTLVEQKATCFKCLDTQRTPFFLPLTQKKGVQRQKKGSFGGPGGCKMLIF